MKRSRVSLIDVAAQSNLAWALWRAARGKRDKQEAKTWIHHHQDHVKRLGHQILDGAVEVGRLRRFMIHDPKPRVIHAPCFEERVLHHALMRHVGPVLDRSWVDDSYACRTGKGTLAAVKRVQHQANPGSWYVKVDVRRYFNSVNHAILLDLVRRRFKNRPLLELLSRIVHSYNVTTGRGLPIGSLTSQFFANHYLDGLDRLVTQEIGCRGYVRYMDDAVWWTASRCKARGSLRRVEEWLAEHRLLAVKPEPQINRSEHGLTLCGFRITPTALRLSRRRKRRYACCRNRWEQRYAQGRISSRTLQTGITSALAITSHASSRHWRRRQLATSPPPPCCDSA